MTRRTKYAFDPLWVKVANSLREQILHGRLKPGELLSENRIAEEFDVSRTPVREALRLLMEEELIEMVEGRKVRVAVPCLEDIAEIYQIRWFIESAAVRELSKDLELAKKVATEMRGCLNQAAQALDKKDIAKLTLANESFHAVLISALRNKRINVQFKTIHNLITMYRRQTLENDFWAVEGNDEHIQLMEFIENGKFVKALVLLERHLHEAKNILIKSV